MELSLDLEEAKLCMELEDEDELGYKFGGDEGENMPNDMSDKKNLMSYVHL